MKTTELNNDQLNAVSYTSGPLLILAGPGSGKTLTITEKVLQLIESGFPPEKILALTFSEKAADEMQNRIEKKIGTGTGITISTFHSFCNDLIRDFSLDMGINHGIRLISKEHSHVWSIKNIDSFKFEYIPIPTMPSDLIKSLLEGTSQFHDQLISPQELGEYVQGQLSSEGEMDVDEIDKLQKLADLAKFYHHYQEYKWNNNFIDYDDMITLACRLLESNEIARKRIQQLYDYILVDEFQDTNYAQLHLVNLLAGAGNLTCVADDDQCIYRFRGAYLSNINQLAEFYPSLEKIALGVNYRSTEPIVNLSQELIGQNPDRQEKQLVSNNGGEIPVKIVKAPNDVSEAEWVADEICRLMDEQSIEPKDIFILTRKRADGKKFSDSLKRHMVPVEYVGSLKISDFPLIQEALAYMRFVADPFNNGIAFAKILSREGVTEHTLQKINIMAGKLRKMDDMQGDGIYSVLLHHLDELDLEQADLVRSILERLQEMIEYKKNHLPSDTLKHLLINMTDLYLSQVHENSKNSRRNIEVLNSLVKIVEDLELIDGGAEFELVMEHLELVFDLEIEGGESTDDNTVKVMTIHQSKGKEAKVVFVCDMATRHLPLQYKSKKFTVPFELIKGVQRDMDEKVLHLEEERRLAYVAMTRAKEHLYLVFPERYTGNIRGVKPSQFLEDIGFTSNPLVELIEVEQVEEQLDINADSPLMKKMAEQESLVNMYTKQGQLKHALESLVLLAQLKELETSGNPENLDLNELLSIDTRDVSELQDLVDNKVPPLVDSKMRFSASKIKTYEDCPLKFKFQSVLHIPTPQKSFFQVGTDVHSVLEEMVKLRMKGETIELDLAKGMLDSSWESSNFDSETQETQEYNKMQKMLEFWFDFEENNPNETIEVEEWFELDLDGAHFGGFIDRLDGTPDGDYIVIDYKTGKSNLSKNKLKEDVQMVLYCLAVKEKYGKLPVQAGHMYAHPELAEVRLVDVSEESVEAVVERIKGIVDRILKEDFEVVGKPNCRFCDYVGICGSHQK
ncbi:ATP-dependent DNA helicase [Methanolobus sp. ZRKC5]|uniref:ATP-dependent helicase n=1 Tax=unclassified Methanolobus TaxID=2629569 RepID=UPI00313DED31